ncbi:hypothetical protein SKAU_G00045350 [Synaphobranchus kaupii]|uniref:Uncharacterized protein n=1 Tax=Synaphobranchus kaupii TaxID=118154 RepID=A0A9Q1G392_SYNKA|nr:hypothetical protein SKAU_G00045350 [Synaphobranchus kaupii]
MAKHGSVLKELSKTAARCTGALNWGCANTDNLSPGATVAPASLTVAIVCRALTHDRPGGSEVAIDLDSPNADRTESGERE